MKFRKYQKIVSTLSQIRRKSGFKQTPNYQNTINGSVLLLTRYVWNVGSDPLEVDDIMIVDEDIENLQRNC